MGINDVLKFSWSHIIAFTAMVFISYVSFLGLTYYCSNYLLAGIGVVMIDIVLFLFFIRPQILKATKRRFAKRIRWERFLIFMSPVVFACAMVPYAHFWTVFEQRERIENIFSNSIKNAKGMFTSYESYAEKRIRDFKKGTSNEVGALEMQLLGENYINIKESAIKWIDDASEANVWNVFMIGNINEVKASIDKWSIKLKNLSSKTMSGESSGVKAFPSEAPSVIEAKSSLEGLKTGLYKTLRAPGIVTIMSAMFLYVFMLLPYMIQRRNTKSLERLFGSKKSKGNDNDDIIIVNYEENKEDGDYKPFSM